MATQCSACHTSYEDFAQLLQHAGALDVSAPPFSHLIYRIEGALVWTLAVLCMVAGFALVPIHLFVQTNHIDTPFIEYMAKGCVAVLLILYTWRWLTYLDHRDRAIRRNLLQMTMLPRSMQNVYEFGYWPPTMLVISQLLWIAGAPRFLPYLALFVGCFDWQSPPRTQTLNERNGFLIDVLLFAMTDNAVRFFHADTVESLLTLENVIICAVFPPFMMWAVCTLYQIIFNRIVYNDLQSLGDKELADKAIVARRKNSFGFGYACDRFADREDMWIAPLASLMYLLPIFIGAFLLGYAHINAIDFAAYTLTAICLCIVALGNGVYDLTLLHCRFSFYRHTPYALGDEGQYRAFRHFIRRSKGDIGQLFDPSRRTFIWYRFDVTRAPASFFNY